MWENLYRLRFYVCIAIIINRCNIVAMQLTFFIIQDNS